MPKTRYARVGDLHVAYQVWGDGPVDLVLVWGTMSHAEIMWEDPKMVRLYERLGRSVRVIQFDRRGTGLSDRPDRLPTLEDRVDDLRAVIDTLGCDRVALLGESEGVPTSILFVATQPESVSHLVLYAPLVRLIRPALSTLNVPTLVLHKADDLLVGAAQGRYVAERIPGAQYIELTGRSHYIADDDADRLVDVTLQFLTGGTSADDKERVLATVLFTDIVASTPKAVALGDWRWRALLDDHDRLVRDVVDRYRGRLVKTTGDGALATFDGPARAVRAGQAIVTGVRRLGIEARAGVHTGEIELRGTDVGGLAVHIGARVAAVAGPGEVFVSRTVSDLVAGSGIEFADRGVHQLKGVPGDWQLFAVTST